MGVALVYTIVDLCGLPLVFSASYSAAAAMLVYYGGCAYRDPQLLPPSRSDTIQCRYESQNSAAVCTKSDRDSRAGSIRVGNREDIEA